jgi:signal transduction histidine kinase
MFVLASLQNKSMKVKQFFWLTYQAEKARSGGNVGLGLAIVQEIDRAHDGRVGVMSKPGQGATFSMQIPLPR